jgi:signal transduction histidine kinase
VILLKGRWIAPVCAAIFLMMVGPIWWRGGLAPALIVGMIVIAGIVFVVVFTRIAVNERAARSEVERLAAELSDANRKLREYATQVEELATVRERNRLAREIHDSLGHYLTVVNVQIEAARAVIDDRDRSLDVLRKAQHLTQEGLAEVRLSVAALRSTTADDRPISETLKALVDECRAAGIGAELRISGEPRDLPSQVELTLYRAAQEGLTNVRKHSHASNAMLALDYGDEKAVRLRIEDDGVGGDVTDGGFGLLGVRERAQLLGGQVRVRALDGRGFSLEVELPA